jgi:TolB protein
MRRSACALLGAVAAVAAVAAGLLAGASPAASSGAWIVFSAHPAGAAAQQLFRVQTTGAGLQQITTGRAPAIAPTASPDGKRLAFARIGSGIFTVGVDGTGLRRLTRNGRDSFPVWSPDGRSIAFLRPLRDQWALFVMSSTGKGQRRLPQAPPAGRPTWLANGKSLLVPTLGDVVQVDARTGATQKSFGLSIDLQTSQTATVSPNGRNIVFVGSRLSTGPADCGEGRCPQYGLYLGSVPAPHRVRRIADDTGPAGWAPDGASLVFVSKGLLQIETVGGRVVATVATGDNVPAGESPPVWLPR